MSLSEMSRRLGFGDRGFLGRALEKLRGDGPRSPVPVQKSVRFTMAFVALAAKMAKADGVAVGVETEAFERCFHVPEAERRNIMRVYELASRDVAGFEIYARRIGAMLRDEPVLLRSVFECLFNIAAADGVLHDAEDAFLRAVAAEFGLPSDAFQSVRRLFVHDAGDPYRILGVDSDVSDEELKRHHRELVRNNHPDKLVGEGVPREFLVLADRKLAVINAAYDAIKKQRGPQPSSEPAGGGDAGV